MKTNLIKFITSLTAQRLCQKHCGCSSRRRRTTNDLFTQYSKVDVHQDDLKLIESLASSEIILDFIKPLLSNHDNFNKPVITNPFVQNFDVDNQVRFRRDTDSVSLEDLFYSVNNKLDDIETIFKETKSTYNFLIEKEAEISSKLTSLELKFAEK